MKEERKKTGFDKKFTKKKGRGERERVQEGRRLAQTLDIDAARLLLVVDLA